MIENKIWSGNLKIVLFRAAFGKIPITSAGLRLEQRFFLMKAKINKLYEYEAVLSQNFLFWKRVTYLESTFYKLQNGTRFNNSWKSYNSSLFRASSQKNIGWVTKLVPFAKPIWSRNLLCCQVPSDCIKISFPSFHKSSFQK